MNRDEILSRIQDICRDVFEDDDLNIDFSTTANDVEDWDSLSHITLINEIESEFNVKFTMGEIQGSKNVGELIDSLICHLKG